MSTETIQTTKDPRLLMAPNLDAAGWLAQMKALRKEDKALHGYVSKRIDEIVAETFDAVRDVEYPRGWGYIRASHDDNVASGGGLDHQEQAIRTYIEFVRSSMKPDLRFGGIFREEVESAWKKRLIERPAGKKMNAILKPGDMVFFSRIDRGFRNLADLMNTLDHNWTPRGVTVVFLDPMVDLGTPYGRMILQVSCAFAELESNVKSARTREALQSQKRRGYAYQKPPWGFKNVGPRGRKKQVPDLDQRRVAEYALWLREDQQKPLKEIAKLAADYESLLHSRKPRRLFWDAERVKNWTRAARRLNLKPRRWVPGMPVRETTAGGQATDSTRQDSIPHPPSDAQ